MAAMPFLCNGTLLFQGNLPRVLPVTILKYASCTIPYFVSFLILHGENCSAYCLKIFKSIFLFSQMSFFCLLQLFWRLFIIVALCLKQLLLHQKELCYQLFRCHLKIVTGHLNTGHSIVRYSNIWYSDPHCIMHQKEKEKNTHNIIL